MYISCVENKGKGIFFFLRGLHLYNGSNRSTDDNMLMFIDKMSGIMRKPAFCLCENRGADQLCSYCTADQRLCFRFPDSTIPLLLKAEIASF